MVKRMTIVSYTPRSASKLPQVIVCWLMPVPHRHVHGIWKVGWFELKRRCHLADALSTISPTGYFARLVALRSSHGGSTSSP